MTAADIKPTCAHGMVPAPAGPGCLRCDEAAQARNPAPSLTGAAAMFALPGAPTVTHEPDELAGEWVFVLAAHGSRQRMRHTELQALYRACDTALNQARAVR